MDGTVLVADDDRTIRTVLTQALTRAGCRVHATASLSTLRRWVEEGKGDLVITDVMMPDGNGIDNINKIKALRPNLPVIVISAQNTIMTAIQANEAEAWDYLPKPFDLPDLLARARKAMESARRSVRGAAIDHSDGATSSATDLPLVGRSPAMQDLYKLVARVMNSDLPVLVSGESGTGKSLVARALHDFSDRESSPFVVATAQDFGADTGGKPSVDWQSKTRHGSFVIDGLGDLDDAAQAGLIRLLDSFGNDGPRIIAIADDTLSAALDAGAFREDLYYRLSGIALHVPPLRERIEDIQFLAEHFLARTSRDNSASRRLSEQAVEVLRKHAWPGNVRQLENTIRRLMITGQDAEIGALELQAALGAHPAATRQSDDSTSGSLSDSVAKHVRRYFELHGDELPQNGVYQRVMREIETPLIEIALEYSGGNQARCADLLGINRNTLRKKLTELDIHVARRRKLM